jgi:hypothetical protein
VDVLGEGAAEVRKNAIGLGGVGDDPRELYE